MMKKLKISILVSALLLATPLLVVNSYGSTINSEFVQCSPYYQKVMSQPLITSEAAIFIDKEKSKEIEIVRQFADEYIMNVNIADLPADIDIAYYENDDVQQTLASGNLLSSESAQQIVLFLASAYYSGHYVAKDEPQAIVYLRKLADYYAQERPESTEELYHRVIMAIAEAVFVEDDTTLTDDYFVLAAFKALVNAGSIDTEAIVIRTDFRESDTACLEPILSKLESIANQGSVYAIGELDKIYTKLHDDNPNNYEAKMEYWQQRAEGKGR